MIMSVLRFLLLAVRPASKLESDVGRWDGINGIVWFAYAIIPSVPGIDLSDGQKLAWFVGIPAVLFLIAGVKLQFRVDTYEERVPKLRYSLLSFPRSGTRILREGEDELQEGSAKIGIRNYGGKVEECYGTVYGISLVSVVRGEIQIHPLVFTSDDLCWDGNGKYMTIVNDGIERYLNLAYIDQHKPGEWRLAIQGNQKKDYSNGWWKIDIAVASRSTEMEGIKIEVALGLGERQVPASGINLWPWDKWQESKLKELKEDVEKEGSES